MLYSLDVVNVGLAFLPDENVAFCLHTKEDDDILFRQVSTTSLTFIVTTSNL